MKILVVLQAADMKSTESKLDDVEAKHKEVDFSLYQFLEVTNNAPSYHLSMSRWQEFSFSIVYVILSLF